MERFYVNAPRAVSARIAAELTLAPASTHLLVGGVGSGKTTELLATERHMAGVPDVVTFYVDVSKQHDIAKMVPGAVIAQVALGFAERLDGRRVLVIEWADKVLSLLPEGRLRVDLRWASASSGRQGLEEPDRRSLSLSGPAANWEARLEGLGRRLAGTQVSFRRGG